MTSGNPHGIINVPRLQPACGTDDAQRDIEIKWRLVNGYAACLEFDIHLSLVFQVRFESHSDYEQSGDGSEYSLVYVFPFGGHSNGDCLPVRVAFLSLRMDGIANETTLRT